MMKKNSKIHVWIETPLLKKLKEEAEKMGISLSDLVKIDRKSTRLNSSHIPLSRMPSSA